MKLLNREESIRLIYDGERAIGTPALALWLMFYGPHKTPDDLSLTELRIWIMVLGAMAREMWEHELMDCPPATA